MRERLRVIRSIAVVALGVVALAVQPRALAAASESACISGCCICDYTGTQCGGVDAWQDCIDNCGVPPVSCDDTDVWDCPGGVFLQCM